MTYVSCRRWESEAAAGTRCTGPSRRLSPHLSLISATSSTSSRTRRSGWTRSSQPGVRSAVRRPRRSLRGSGRAPARPFLILAPVLWERTSRARRAGGRPGTAAQGRAGFCFSASLATPLFAAPMAAMDAPHEVLSARPRWRRRCRHVPEVRPLSGGKVLRLLGIGGGVRPLGG
jgi:hypothetical protein